MPIYSGQKIFITITISPTYVTLIDANSNSFPRCKGYSELFLFSKVIHIYVKLKASPCLYVTYNTRSFQTWLYSSTVEKGDSPNWLTFSSFQGFPMQLSATVPARTPETQALWPSAKQDFLPEHFCWLLLFCVVLFVQEDGQLILEGLLNIYWGLRRPIRLQMFDDNERFRLNRLSCLICTSYRGLNGLNWEVKVMWEQCSLVKTWKKSLLAL